MLTLLVIDPLVADRRGGRFRRQLRPDHLAARRNLRRNSQRISSEQTQVVKALQEGLGGIRDVLLDGTQPVYCDMYRRADRLLRRAQGNNIVISNSPRYSWRPWG